MKLSYDGVCGINGAAGVIPTGSPFEVCVWVWWCAHSVSQSGSCPTQVINCQKMKKRS